MNVKSRITIVKIKYDEKAEILRNRLHGVKVHTPVPPGKGDVYVN